MDGTSLTDLVKELLARADASRSGRAAHTVHGGRDHALHQTVVGSLGT